MSEEPKSPMEAERESSSEEESVAFLRRALGTPPRLERSLLPGVQARIRRETRGRYFNARRRPFRDPTLLLLAAAMLLLLLAAAFFGLFGALLP
jgi:hypothetical protein